jgi:threonyl-tRNA synthetase
MYIMTALGMEKDISYRFSRRDPANHSKYVGSPEEWDNAENWMEKILKDLDIEYKEGIGEAAFYGPKLDIQTTNVFGKEDTLLTIQIDLVLAQRFEMTYVDVDGNKKYPYIIHRSSIGCYERTLAFLIEKYNGALPLWLAPVQVKVLSLTDRTADKTNEIKEQLLQRGVRAEVDVRSEKIGYKIREAQLEKVPYMFVVGDKEAESCSVSVRHRKHGDLGAMKLDEIAAKISADNANKTCSE